MNIEVLPLKNEYSLQLLSITNTFLVDVNINRFDLNG